MDNNTARSAVRWAITGLACCAAWGSVHGATPVAPTGSAAAASAPAPVRGPRDRPLPSPAVRAAQGAAAPGELRPENPVVPQIAVPLRRDRPAAGDRAGSAPGVIDDSAARCRAASNDRDRAACIRNGTLPAPLQKR